MKKYHMIWQEEVIRRKSDRICPGTGYALRTLERTRTVSQHTHTALEIPISLSRLESDPTSDISSPFRRLSSGYQMQMYVRFPHQPLTRPIIPDFDLVRLHHPDSSHIRTSSPPLPTDVVHARFRAIKAAYDFLSGKSRSPHPNARPHPRASHFDPYVHELARRRRAHRNASSFGYAHARDDDGSNQWDDGEGWGPRRGWANGFGAPKDQQGEWNQDGWRERLILSFGVMVLALL